MRNDRLDFFFTMTATLRPSRLFKTCAMSVVLPAPRKPDKTVTGNGPLPDAKGLGLGLVDTCYRYMHPTRVRITSSCYALRVRGARDEVTWRACDVRACEGSTVRVLYFCAPSNHNTPSTGSDGF